MFWKKKKLEDLTTSEWESLCDGCAICCLNKIEEEETNKIFYTNVACSQLDLKTHKCKSYKKRQKVVDDCLQVTLKDIPTIKMMPETCAYRRLYEKKPLPSWHYLISGDRNLVHKQNLLSKKNIISENEIDINDLENYICFEQT